MTQNKVFILLTLAQSLFFSPILAQKNYNQMTNAALITQFYTAFVAADAEAMVACYADDITFEDPAFGKLQGEAAKNMWRMLMASSKGNIKITFSEVQANDNTGSARWQAEYEFSQTGRKVVNNVSAKFAFRDGKITQHTDHFDMWRWSRQALGVSGYLLGWSGFMRQKVQQKTRALLQKYTEKRNDS